jgi:hypothetical protein
LVQVALIRELHTRIGCSVRDAVSFAATLLADPNGLLALGPRLTLGFDRERFEHDLHRRLTEALESAPRPQRGRPRQRGPTPRGAN